jgi:hypothetical protein
MRIATIWRRPVLIAGLSLCLLGAVAGTAAAAGEGWLKREAKASKCKRGYTLVEIQHRICPANGRRKAIVVRRACCEKRGKRTCKAFIKCPKISPDRDDD